MRAQTGRPADDTAIGGTTRVRRIASGSESRTPDRKSARCARVNAAYADKWGWTMTGIEVALVILAGGWVAGGAHDRLRKMLAERKAARERAVAGPEPICGCRHHLAYHDPKDGRCYAVVKGKQGRGGGSEGKAGKSTGVQGKPSPAEGAGALPVPAQCPCRRYAGPEPLATLYAAELTDVGRELPDGGSPPAREREDPA